MSSKKIGIGNVLVGEYQGRKTVSLALGKKNKNPDYTKYDLSVEILVRDNTGKVIAHQTDGFLNLEDPRTRPDDLLSAGKITEEVAEKMRAGVANLSDKVKFELTIPRS